MDVLFSTWRWLLLNCERWYIWLLVQQRLHESVCILRQVTEKRPTIIMVHVHQHSVPTFIGRSPCSAAPNLRYRDTVNSMGYGGPDCALQSGPLERIRHIGKPPIVNRQRFSCRHDFLPASTTNRVWRTELSTATEFLVAYYENENKTRTFVLAVCPRRCCHTSAKISTSRPEQPHKLDPARSFTAGLTTVKSSRSSAQCCRRTRPQSASTTQTQRPPGASPLPPTPPHS